MDKELNQFKGFADPIAIFRTGDHTDSSGAKVTITEAHLDQMIANFKKDTVPFVIGHPKADAPAFGWSAGLHKEDGVLYTDSVDVNSDFEAGVEKGSFRNRSIALNQNEAGDYYVRHIGWLGAAAPAIKGLDNMAFADDGKFTEFEFSDSNLVESVRSTGWALNTVYRMMRNVKNNLIASLGIEKADEQIPEYELENLQTAAKTARDTVQKTDDHTYAEITHLNKEDDMPKINAKPEGDNSDAVTFSEEDVNTKVADAEKAAEKRAELKFAHKQNCIDIANKLEADGKILPAEVPAVIEFLESQSTALSFKFTEGEGDNAKQVEINQFDQAVKLFSAKGDRFSHLKENIVTDDNAPKGVPTDAKAIGAKAQEFIASEATAGRTISIAAAVDHVTAEAN